MDSSVKKKSFKFPDKNWRHLEAENNDGRVSGSDSSRKYFIHSEVEYTYEFEDTGKKEFCIEVPKKKKNSSNFNAILLKTFMFFLDLFRLVL